jgi:hypothetical protein
MAIPQSGITTTLVGQTIGLGSNDVGTLCKSIKINPWSRYKPGYLYVDSNNHMQFQLPRGMGYADHRGSYLGRTDEGYNLGDFRGYNHQATAPSVTSPGTVTAYTNTSSVANVQFMIGEIDWLKTENSFHPAMSDLPTLSYAMLLMTNSSGVILPNIYFTLDWNSDGSFTITPSSTPSSPARSTLTFSVKCYMSNSTTQYINITLNPTDLSASSSPNTSGDTLTMVNCSLLGCSPTFDNNYNYSANKNVASLSGITQNGIISIPLQLPAQSSTGTYTYYFKVFLSTDGLSSIIDIDSLDKATSTGSAVLNVTNPPTSASFTLVSFYKLTSTDINDVSELQGTDSSLTSNAGGYSYNAGNDSNTANNLQYQDYLYADKSMSATEAPTSGYMDDGLYTPPGLPGSKTYNQGASNEYKVYTRSVSQYSGGKVIATNTATWKEYTYE